VSAKRSMWPWGSPWQILGFWLLPKENATAWEGVLKERWGRGPRWVLLFVGAG
jgi:putative transposase